jgi:hypothetical protein
VLLEQVDQWDQLAHRVAEVQLEGEDLLELLGCLECPEVLEDPESLDHLDKVELLEFQEGMENLVENVVKMISEKYAHLS